MASFTLHHMKSLHNSSGGNEAGAPCQGHKTEIPRLTGGGIAVNLYLFIYNYMNFLKQHDSMAQ